MNRTRSRTLKALAAVLVTAAVGAPVTQAAVDVDARHQTLLDRAQQSQVDARHGALLRHHDAGPSVYVSRAPAKSSGAVQGSDGMDWGDAGIGAAVMAGVIIVGAGGALVGRKQLASA